MALTNLSQITTSGISTLADINVNNITGVAATFTGNVTVGGTLTYDDVTNIDSVGLITARSGIDVSGTSIFRGPLQAQDNLEISGEIVHLSDADTRIRFPSNDTITLQTAGSERLRITSAGKVGIGTESPSTMLEVGSQSQTLAGAITISNGETIAGGSGPLINLKHGPAGGTQRTHQIYSYIGDLRIVADSNENMEFHTGGSESLRITSDGDVNALTGHLQAQDFKLGLAANRYPIIQRAVQSSGSQDLSITGGSGYSEDSSSPHSLVDAREGAMIKLGAGDPTSDTYGGYIKYFAHGHTSPNASGQGNAHVFYTRSGADTNTERLRITSGGNVGIGTDNPGAKLDVRGTVRIHNELKVALGNGVSPEKNVARIVLLGYHGITGAQNWALRGAYQHASGINVNADGGDLDLIKSFAGNTILATKTDGSSLGKVGIGLTNPDEELTVVGTVKVVGSSDPSVRVSSTDTAYNGSMRLNTTNNTLEFFTRYGGTYYTNNLVLKQGNVGIGTDNPNKILKVEYSDPGSGSNGLTQKDTGNDTTTFFGTVGPSYNYIGHSGHAGMVYSSRDLAIAVDHNNSGVIKFYTGNAERLRITSTGKLEAYKGTSTTGKTSGSEAFTVGNGGGNHRFAVYPDGTTVIGGTGDIANNNIILQNDGKIGVGIHNPTGNLHVGSGSGQAPANSAKNIVIDGSGAVGMGILFGTSANTAYGNIYWGNSTDGSGDGRITYFGSTYSVANDRQAMVFRTAGSEALRINSSGSLLVNTTSNSSIGGQTPSLTVSSYTNLDGLRIRGLDTGNTIWKDGGDMSLTVASAHSIYLKTQSATRLKVRSDGKISAGTLLDTSNSYEFSIRGADGTGCLYAHGRNHYLSNRSNAYASLTLKKANSDSNGIDYLQLRDSSNALKGQITGAGNWKPIAGGGIDFSADGNTSGMTSELLDDYEEGTFTVSSTGILNQGSLQTAHYVKIGNVVHYMINIYQNANNMSWSAGSTITISAFTPISSFHTSPSLSWYTNSSTSDTQPAYFNSNNVIVLNAARSGVRHLWGFITVKVQ